MLKEFVKNFYVANCSFLWHHRLCHSLVRPIFMASQKRKNKDFLQISKHIIFYLI